MTYVIQCGKFSKVFFSSVFWTHQKTRAIPNNTKLHHAIAWNTRETPPSFLSFMRKLCLEKHELKEFSKRLQEIRTDSTTPNIQQRILSLPITFSAQRLNTAMWICINAQGSMTPTGIFPAGRRRGKKEKGGWEWSLLPQSHSGNKVWATCRLVPHGATTAANHGTRTYTGAHTKDKRVLQPLVSAFKPFRHLLLL